jgi:hypothetical protein
MGTTTKPIIPIYGMLTPPRKWSGRRNSHVNPAVVTRAVPRRLTQWLESKAKTGLWCICSEPSF